MSPPSGESTPELAPIVVDLVFMITSRQATWDMVEAMLTGERCDESYDQRFHESFKKRLRAALIPLIRQPDSPTTESVELQLFV